MVCLTAGVVGVRVCCDFHVGSHHESHRLRICLSSRRLLAQRLERLRLRHRYRWVIKFRIVIRNIFVLHFHLLPLRDVGRRQLLYPHAVLIKCDRFSWLLVSYRAMHTNVVLRGIPRL